MNKEEAKQIVKEFVEKELLMYIQDLGENHTYNGVSNIKTLKDIKEAFEVWTGHKPKVRGRNFLV